MPKLDELTRFEKICFLLPTAMGNRNVTGALLMETINLMIIADGHKDALDGGLRLKLKEVFLNGTGVDAFAVLLEIKALYQ